MVEGAIPDLERTATAEVGVEDQSEGDREGGRNHEQQQPPVGPDAQDHRLLGRRDVQGEQERRPARDEEPSEGAHAGAITHRAA